MSLSIKLSENGGAAPEAVPYMPAGRSEISATVNGAPGRRVVVADRAAAERLNADLAEKLQAAAEHRKARPLVMFDHNVQGGAAAVPVGFEWDDERGILLRVEWTQAGREAVEGGNYGYVSPSFRLRPGSGEILGLADGVEVGSLVNDPAFERNECIAAGRADMGEDVVVHAANPYGCNQHGHEWVAEHGEGWGGGGQQEDTLDSIKKRKFDIGSKQQEVDNELVKLAKQSEAEKDLEKRKKINAKIAEVSQKKQKLMEQYRKLAMKETELKDRERQEKTKQEKERFSKAKSDTDLDKEADDFLKGSHDERWVKVTQWRAEVRKAKDEALYIRESTAYRKGEPEAIKKYNEAKEKANKAAQRVRNIVKKANEKRGYSGKKLDFLLRHYPETVLSAHEEEEQEREFELVCAGAVSMLDALPPRGNEREGGGSGYDGGKPGGVGSGNNQKKGKNMEEIAKLLGLPEDADAATICAKITALKNQGAVDKKRIEEVEAEKEEHKKALTEHKHAAADAFMERVKKEGKVAPHDKERLQAARNMYLADPAGAECIFAGMKRVDNVRDEQKVEADKVEAAAARRYENLSLAELLAEENA